MEVDHVVLWLEDPKKALAFYTDLLGLNSVRAPEYDSGSVGFPSVRINETTIVT